MPAPWPLISSKSLGDFRIFSIRSDLKTSPRTGLPHEFFVLECVDWVNVVPVTEGGDLVMVEQWRHGSDTVELELPGGVMDEGDGSPLVTAVRELREETGWVGGEPEIIGSVYSNPAIMNNRCYTVMIRGCRRVGVASLDPGEDLRTRTVGIAEAYRLVATGQIRHSLVVAALLHLRLQNQD